MSDLRKKGRPRTPGAAVVPTGLPVFDALERAGLVIVMRGKPATKPDPAGQARSRKKLSRPR
ncbi:MAG: hypothetical protein IPI67_00710 [Myxococcales bacterium]|nr:hypothetical protein [Myxococcales bacterium]